MKEKSPKKFNTHLHAIVLFDGYCNFCSRSVRFIHQRDHHDYFRFAGLESEKGQKVLKKYVEEPGAFNSVILIENEKLYTKSTAALKIAKKLSGLWPVLYLFIVIPKSIRDGVYRLIARNRYKWFGKKETCFMPDENLKKRFL
mgnify:CR=1 FL=1